MCGTGVVGGGGGGTGDSASASDAAADFAGELLITSRETLPLLP